MWPNLLDLHGYSVFVDSFYLFLFLIQFCTLWCVPMKKRTMKWENTIKKSKSIEWVCLFVRCFALLTLSGSILHLIHPVDSHSRTHTKCIRGPDQSNYENHWNTHNIRCWTECLFFVASYEQIVSLFIAKSINWNFLSVYCRCLSEWFGRVLLCKMQWK